MGDRIDQRDAAGTVAVPDKTGIELMVPTMASVNAISVSSGLAVSASATAQQRSGAQRSRQAAVVARSLMPV